MNIRRRFAWLILVAALPAAGTVFFVAWREYGALRASTEETALLAARTVSMDYGKDLHRLRIGAALLAAMPALYEAPPRALRRRSRPGGESRSTGIRARGDGTKRPQAV